MKAVLCKELGLPDTLVSATYPLEQAAQALKDVVDRKVQGKIVLVM